MDNDVIANITLKIANTQVEGAFCQSSENSMGVYVNFGCFGTGFKPWLKRNLNSCHKEE